MGMDLRPRKPHKNHPATAGGFPVWGRYSWHGWKVLIGYLNMWGVDTSEFDVWNEGRPISAQTTKLVADALERHLPELPKEEQKWLQHHIVLWRTCGGYWQW